jgi:hypothetical protein
MAIQTLLWVDRLRVSATGDTPDFSDRLNGASDRKGRNPGSCIGIGPRQGTGRVTALGKPGKTNFGAPDVDLLLTRALTGALRINIGVPQPLYLHSETATRPESVYPYE